MLAEGQHGVVARRQLVELGLSDAQVKRRITQGRLHVVHRGVLRLGIACWAHAVAGWPQCSSAVRRQFSAINPQPSSGVSRIVVVGRSISPAEGAGEHRRESSSIATRSPWTRLRRWQGYRALCPSHLPRSCWVASRDELERVISQIEVRRLTHSLSVYDLLERYPRRRGASMLRALLDDRLEAHGITRSRLEDRFVALLTYSDLPRPQLNASLAMRGRFFEVDCLWRKQRVIVELDGMQAHGTDLAFEKDRERDRLLIADGWRVARITWRQLRDDAPSVLTDLRRVLHS
jgi:hypothetical protein